MGESICVVTGGNRGIGLEICRQLAERGAQVVLAARDEARGREAAEKLPGTVRVRPLDVRDDASARNLARYLEAEFGRCDVLVNNAAIMVKEDEDKTVLTSSPEAFEATLASNTVAPLRLTQLLLPLLRKSADGGRVINISSGMGALEDFSGERSSPAYSLSKASLNLVTRMLAGALQGEGIAVNSVCPGWVKTDMGGAQAPRSVAEGADTPVWLALDAPINLTGKFLRDREEIAW